MCSYCSWTGRVARSPLKAGNVPSSILWHTLTSIKWNCHWKYRSHSLCSLYFSFPPSSLVYMVPSCTNNRIALAELLPWSCSPWGPPSMCDRKKGWSRTGNEWAAGDRQKKSFYSNGNARLRRIMAFAAAWWFLPIRSPAAANCPIEVELRGDLFFMWIFPLCFQYNRKEAYLDHPEKTHFPM